MQKKKLFDIGPEIENLLCIVARRDVSPSFLGLGGFTENDSNDSTFGARYQGPFGLPLRAWLEAKARFLCGEGTSVVNSHLFCTVSVRRLQKLGKRTMS